jgi:hypothetical protein
MTTAEDVVRVARTWIATPFIHQHRARGIGVDCAGLLIGVARELRLVAPDFDVTGYGRAPVGDSLRRYCDEHLERAPALVYGGVVLVAYENTAPHHVGIVADCSHGGHSMIHAEGKRRRKVIETRLLFGRSLRFVAAYTFPGVA